MTDNDKRSKPVSLGRHAAECKICTHPLRDEIEREKNNGTEGVEEGLFLETIQISPEDNSPIAERVRKVTAQLQNLEPRKVNYTRDRMEGKSKKQAALDAGYSNTMAEHAAGTPHSPIARPPINAVDHWSQAA